MNQLIGLIFFLLFCNTVPHLNYAKDNPFQVSSNFEGGSAKVLSLDAETQTVRITPAGDPQRGMPNWWYLKIEGIDTSKTLILEVEARDVFVMNGLSGQGKKLSPDWAWPTRAAISLDRRHWAQTEAGQKHGNKMVYRIKSQSTSLWLAWGPPFTPTDAIKLADDLARDYKYVKSLTLTQSVEGRRVPLLRICDEEKTVPSRPAIWVQARQHAWEVGGTWVADGLAHWLLSSDPQAIWLRQHAEIYIVPIMDVDHVATGDGGKNGHPHDHNRDWNDKPHWPEVASAQRYIQMLTKKNQMNIFLDLHNPAASNKVQTMYVLDKSYMASGSFLRQQQFLGLMSEYFGQIKQHLNNPRPAIATPDERVSEVWVLDNANQNTVAFCVETPWNSPNGTVEGYHGVGRKLGKVMEKMLR